MKHFAKMVAVSLAVLALGVAQLLGLSRGYFCECTGNVIAEPVAECESGHCHAPCGSDEKKPGDSCPGHSVAAQKLQAQAVSGAATFPAPVLVAVPFDFNGCALPQLVGTQISGPRAAKVIGASPPTAAWIVRSVVLLV